MRLFPGQALRWAVPLLVLLLLLGGCSLFHRRRSRPRPPYKKLSPPVAYEIMRDNPEMLVLDLRRPEEYNGRSTGHIRRARNIPVGRLPYRLLEIAQFRDDTLLVYCHEGDDCGEQGVKVLLASGFENVILMDGGIEGWIRGGFKTVLPANLVGKRGQDEEPLMPAKPQAKHADQEVPVTPPPPPPSSPPPGRRVAAPRQIG